MMERTRCESVTYICLASHYMIGWGVCWYGEVWGTVQRYASVIHIAVLSYLEAVLCGYLSVESIRRQSKSINQQPKEGWGVPYCEVPSVPPCMLLFVHYA